MALSAQLVSAGQTADAATDDGDAFARFLFRFGEGQTLFDRIVAQKLLDRVDADIVLHTGAVATVLARRRADAAHDGRERVALSQPAPGIFLPRHGRLAVRADWWLLNAAHNIEPTADVLASRATALARWRALNVGRAFV